MIIAVLAATGTHWAVLQSVAWTTMLAENLQSASLEKAVACTFDGKHPCCICRAIAKGKQSEKKTDLQIEAKKLDYSYTACEFVFCPPTEFYEMRTVNEAVPLLMFTPPLPPPKELLG
jgi:hypothetical protein